MIVEYKGEKDMKDEFWQHILDNFTIDNDGRSKKKTGCRLKIMYETIIKL